MAGPSEPSIIWAAKTASQPRGSRTWQLLILGMHRDTNSAVRPAVALQRELRQVSAGTMPLKELKESSSKGSMQLPIKNPVSTNTEKLSTRTKHITTWVISLQRWGPRDPYFFLLCFWFCFKCTAIYLTVSTAPSTTGTWKSEAESRPPVLYHFYYLQEYVLVKTQEKTAEGNTQPFLTNPAVQCMEQPMLCLSTPSSCSRLALTCYISANPLPCSEDIQRENSTKYFAKVISFISSPLQNLQANLPKSPVK